MPLQPRHRNRRDSSAGKKAEDAKLQREQHMYAQGVAAMNADFPSRIATMDFQQLFEEFYKPRIELTEQRPAKLRHANAVMIVGPSAIPVDAGVDPWRAFDRVVCSIDSVKPVGYRSGVDPEEIDRRNEQRFSRLVDAGWDLAIIDEALATSGAAG